MTPDELDAQARRANISFASVPGYMGCRVHSYDRPIVAHQFSTYLDAERFQGGQVMIASGYYMDPQNTNVVLQKFS